MPETSAIGFLGAGKMATALAQGFLKAGLTTAAQVKASDPSVAAREAFSQATQASTTGSNREVVEGADTLFLSVKPDQVPTLLDEIHSWVGENHLIISIAAGLPLAKLEDRLPRGSRVIRVMPNTPALVGSSATAIALGESATQADGDFAVRLFSSVGIAHQVPEKLMDAVTGLSGSGPAYAYLMIEALSDGAVAAGLPREMATQLAAQTLLGSARMVLESGKHPGALKDMVTSPGGTTIEGVHELEKGGLRGILMNAVQASASKSRRLGRE